MTPDQEALAFFNSIRRKARVSLCLHPDQKACKGKIVKAHSIQSARYLKPISRGGKVAVFGPRSEDGQLKSRFQLKGIGIATTFSGFCGHHDRETFDPIENAELTSFTKWQTFLFVYRSFAREFHAKLEAVRILETVQPGFMSTREAHWYRLGIRDAFIYKRVFDSAILSRNPDGFILCTLQLSGHHPIALSGCLSIDRGFSGHKIYDTTTTTDRVPLLFLNLLPHKTSLSILVGVLGEDGSVYGPLINYLSSISEQELCTTLSYWALAYSENWAVSPELLSTWPGEKKERMEAFFQETLFDGGSYPDFASRVGSFI